MHVHDLPVIVFNKWREPTMTRQGGPTDRRGEYNGPL